MSEASDNALNYFLSSFKKSNGKRVTFQKGAGQGKWRISNGKSIPISSMSDEHLENALRIALKNASGKAKDIQSEMANRKRKENENENQ